MSTVSPRRDRLCRAAAATAAAALLLCACGHGAGTAKAPQAVAAEPDSEAYLAQKKAAVAAPETGAAPAYENDYFSLETAYADSGYLVANCGGITDQKLKLQVSLGDKIYYYDLRRSAEPLIFPLQMGSGTYTVILYSNISGDRYATVASLEVTANIADEYAPFLLSNDYVRYTADSNAVTDAFLLTKDAQDDLARVKEIFLYITQNVTYDYHKADTVQSGYLPDIDETLATGTGICFDYASLFAAMLRANGIPAKLVTGYVQPENIYHAWNMVYITDVGWINAEIEFDGRNWQLMDPTFTSTGSTKGAQYYPVNEY